MREYVALLRGINVGGNNLLPMKALASIFLDAGCLDVRTYIQSGNVVFRTSDSSDLVPRIQAVIKEAHGIHSPIVLRDLDEMKAVVSGNPFAGADDQLLYVVFLSDKPSQEAIASLDPDRSAPDRYQVVGKEIYLNLVTGAAKTKLTNPYFESRLGTIGTARNWRTVNKLVEMMS